MEARAIRVVVLAALAGLVLAPGCGGKSTPPAPSTPLPGYLAVYPRERPSAVYFLQWEQAGDSVAGTLSIAYPNPAGEVTTTTRRVKGKLDGDRLSLDVGTDPAQQWTGTRVGPTITFDAELGDGTGQTLIFRTAKLAAYKRAVAEQRGRS